MWESFPHFSFVWAPHCFLHADDAGREVEELCSLWASENTSDAACRLLRNKALLSLPPAGQGPFPSNSDSRLGNSQLVLLWSVVVGTCLLLLNPFANRRIQLLQGQLQSQTLLGSDSVIRRQECKLQLEGSRSDVRENCIPRRVLGRGRWRPSSLGILEVPHLS